jgi:hypothetical protein
VQLKSGLLEAASVAGAVVGAYYAVDKAVQATVGEFVKYADEVRNFSQITGVSAEETSRLIQVADDYKVSTDALTKAQKSLAKEGYNLTLESLAQLSDEYLKVNDGQERMNFLVKYFGKSGADFAEIMLAGGDAIRSKSEAVQGSLILDQKALDAAREYQRQQDELNDSIKGIKIAIGEWALPGLNELFNALERASGQWQNFFQGLAYTREMKALARTMAEANGITSETYNHNEQLRKSYEDAALENMILTRQIEKEAAARSANQSETEKAVAAYQELHGIYGPLTEDEEKAALEAYKLANAIADAGDEAAKAAEELRNTLVKEMDWELMYTGLKTAQEESDAVFNLIGDQLQALSEKGAELWNGLLLATGKISPEAAKAFLEVQQAYSVMKDMLDRGIEIDIIIQYMQVWKPDLFGNGGGQGGSGHSALHQAWLDYWNHVPGATRPSEPDPGWATGGISTGSLTGHWELLHGTEMIIPLGNGRAGASASDNSAALLAKLDRVIRAVEGIPAGLQRLI